jgi:hypothetical protein
MESMETAIAQSIDSLKEQYAEQTKWFSMRKNIMIPQYDIY